VTTPAEVLARAQQAIGQGCVYRLGKGGYDPKQPYPWSTPAKLCDCSGFAAWCLGASRKTDSPWYKTYNGGWLETTAIVRDCGTNFGLFDPVAWLKARPSDFVVYGDKDGHQGHVGVIATVNSLGPLTVIHCSSGNFKRAADAIQETAATPWVARNGIVARCAYVLAG
jgi:hypothetical protein